VAAAQQYLRGAGDVAVVVEDQKSGAGFGHRVILAAPAAA
jgi:hypothetical protein